MLEITRPLVIFDFETTGIDVTKDRVWQIGLIKVYPDGTENEWETLIDPGIAIPEEVREATKNDEFPEGITDERLFGQPKFEAVAPLLLRGFQGSDLCGYNIRSFDIPILEAEFKRLGTTIDLSGAKVVDAFKLYTRVRPRNLTSFVRDSLGEEAAEEFSKLAHSALPDAKWTWRALKGFLAKFPEIPRTPEAIHQMLFERDGNNLCGGKFYFLNGVCMMNFGKFKGVALNKVDSGYLQWIIRQDFEPEVKAICAAALKGEYPKP